MYWPKQIINNNKNSNKKHVWFVLMVLKENLCNITQIVPNSNCDNNQIVTTLIVTKHNLWQNYIVKKNSNFDFTHIVKNSNCVTTQLVKTIKL